MSPYEEQTIVAFLTQEFTTFKRENREDHGVLKAELQAAIKGTEKSLRRTMGGVGRRVHDIEKHCAARQIEVAAQFAANKLESEAMAAAAKLEAVRLATTPTEADIAVRWFAGKTKKLILGLGALCGVIVVVIEVLRATGVIS